jgi:hypothetical protein
VLPGWPVAILDNLDSAFIEQGFHGPCEISLAISLSVGMFREFGWCVIAAAGFVGDWPVLLLALGQQFKERLIAALLLPGPVQ